MYAPCCFHHWGFRVGNGGWGCTASLSPPHSLPGPSHSLPSDCCDPHFAPPPLRQVRWQVQRLVGATEIAFGPSEHPRHRLATAHTRTHSHMHAHSHAHTHTHTHTHTHVHAQLHTYTCMHTYLHTHTACTRVHTHMHAHTHTHTRTPLPSPSPHSPPPHTHTHSHTQHMRITSCPPSPWLSVAPPTHLPA